MNLVRLLPALALSLTASAHGQSALTKFLNDNDMSPVPLFYQDDVAPAVTLTDSCCTNKKHTHELIGMSTVGAGLIVRVGESTVIQDTITKERTKEFTAKVMSLDPSLKIQDTDHLEVKATTLRIAKLIPQNPTTHNSQLDEAIYRDPQTAELLKGWVGVKGVFTYLVEGIAYATSLEVTENSTHNIIAGLGAAPPKCTDPAPAKADDKANNKDAANNDADKNKDGTDAPKPPADKAGDKVAAEPKKAAPKAAAPKADGAKDEGGAVKDKTGTAGSFLSSITKYFCGVSFAICTNESGHAVLNSPTPVPVGVKVIKIYLGQKDPPTNVTGLDYITSLLPNQTP